MVQEEQTLHQQQSQQPTQQSQQAAPSIVEEEASSFDIMEWVFKIINHWYLFLIAGVIAFSLAYLKNRRVIESYLTTGTLIIQESSGGGYGSSALMQGRQMAVP